MIWGIRYTIVRMKWYGATLGVFLTKLDTQVDNNRDVSEKTWELRDAFCLPSSICMIETVVL